MKQLYTPTGEILLVKVPKDITDRTFIGASCNTCNKVGLYHCSEADYCGNNTPALKLYNEKGFTESIHLPKGNWKILTNVSKLTEEQAKNFVDKPWIESYKDYERPACGYRSSIQSFHSLMYVNECYLENPYSEKPPSEPVITFKDIDEAEFIGAEYKIELQQWQKAQESTGDYLILIEDK